VVLLVQTNIALTEKTSEPAEVLDAGLRKFHAHHARNRAADDPRENREDQIKRPDVLVIGRHEPAGEKCRLVIGIMMMVMGVGLKSMGVGGNISHSLSSWSRRVKPRKQQA
jgi:hypothetical protein